MHLGVGRYSALEKQVQKLNGEVKGMVHNVEHLAHTNGSIVVLAESMAHFIAGTAAVRSCCLATRDNTTRKRARDATADSASSSKPSSPAPPPSGSCKSAKSSGKSIRRRPATLADMRERAKTPKDPEDQSSAEDERSVGSIKMQALLKDKLPKRFLTQVHLRQLETVMRAVIDAQKPIKAAAIVARTGFGRVQVDDYLAALVKIGELSKERVGGLHFALAPCSSIACVPASPPKPARTPALDPCSPRAMR